LHTSTPVFLLEEQLDVKNIPDKPAEKVSHVLIYSNADRHWIYNTQMMLKLVDELPDISFTFVGDASLSLDDKANARSLGRVSQDELFTLYRSGAVLVRITSHDGMPRMVIEAMYFGMNVITNWPIANAHQCKTLEEIKSALSTKFAFNQQGYDYVRQELNLELWKTRLLDLVKINNSAN
jgi:glycosyltransferase involved in cell wall biosynthesis